jgi:micrococcal nuclease
MTPAYRYRATCERVIDGDTVVLRVDLGFRVHTIIHLRLRGYSAPELHEPGGQEAKTVALRLLAAAEHIIVETWGKSFDRWVGDVWVDDQSLAALLATSAPSGGIGT